MTYRVLIDENTSPRVAELLRGNGHEATHVTTTLQAGVSDRDIADYAAENGCVVLTRDDDFLLPEYRGDITVLYYSDDVADASEIADRVDRVSQYVPDPADLPQVTNIGSWE
jgi:hypothetical protein